MTAAAHEGNSGEDGFTLLEILVGLAISALIMVGLSAAMRSVDLGWKQTTAAGERQNMLATGLRIVAGDLARVERIYDDPGAPMRFLFVGGGREAVFPIVERDGHNQQGLYWVRLYQREARDGVELVRARSGFVPGRQDLAAIAWRDEVVLIHGPFDISLSYLSPVPGAASWSSGWPLQNRLPRQVRVDISSVGGKSMTLPPFIVALRNSAELACLAEDASLCTIRTGGSLVPVVKAPQ